MEMLVNSKATVKQVFIEADHSSVVYRLSKERPMLARGVGSCQVPWLVSCIIKRKKRGEGSYGSQKEGSPLGGPRGLLLVLVGESFRG